jgi:mRNA-degrading endonuclease RelE of RelBE toxin-antitoxin system
MASRIASAAAIEPPRLSMPSLMLGRLAGTWSARVGTYRILYTIEGPEAGRRVVVRSIRHRAVAYGR